jgi:hypothetical protein
MSKQGHKALFASAQLLEDMGIGYQMAYSGKTLRCLVIQPRDWEPLYVELSLTTSEDPDLGQRYPIVINTEDFREHVRRQQWRVSEWQ